MQNCVDDRVTRRQRISGLIRDIKIVRLCVMLVLGALGSIPLVLLTPPFQVPDEVQHFYRAYQLSDLQIRAQVYKGVSGGNLPVSLQELVKSSVVTQDAIRYPATPAPIAQTVKLSSIPLDNAARQFIAFPGSAFYSPLPYLPQVLGIALGRLFGLGPLYLLYLGRFFNCLAALGLVALAVYLMPVAAELVLLVGLLPMSLFLYASVSPDASVIACALFFTALSFSASTRGNWKTWELVAAAMSAAVFCSVKPPYAPLVLAGLIPGLSQRKDLTAVLRSHVILLATALGAAGGWLLFAKSSMTSPLGGGHPSLQLSLILHHPAFFIRAIAHTLRFGNLVVLYRSAVGVFGWFTVALRPVFAIFLPVVNFAIVWSLGVRCTAGRSLLRSLWYLAIALASVLLVMTAIYLMASKVGEDEIVGVQGRYFIPLLVLLGMAAMELSPRRRPSDSTWPALAWTSSIVALQILATDVTIIRAFHVF